MTNYIKVKCSNCEETVQRRKHHIYNTTFCCKECEIKFKSTGEYLQCSFCGEEIYKTQSQLKRSKTGSVFCNRSCAASHNNQFKKGSKHGNWKGGAAYRIRALKELENECSSIDCELKNKIDIPVKMLDVHHKDGDRSNNGINNLEVLCVWCHAKQTRNI